MNSPFFGRTAKMIENKDEKSLATLEEEELAMTPDLYGFGHTGVAEIAGSRPLSTVIEPVEEYQNIERGYFTVQSTNIDYRGQPGTEVVIDSVIPCNRIIFSPWGVDYFTSFYIYMSLGPDIKADPAQVNFPQNTDMMINSVSSTNPGRIGQFGYSVDVPMCRHRISMCLGMGAAQSVGQQIPFTIIFQYLKRR